MRGHLPSQVDAMTLPDYRTVKSVVDQQLDEIHRTKRREGDDFG